MSNGISRNVISLQPGKQEPWTVQGRYIRLMSAPSRVRLSIDGKVTLEIETGVSYPIPAGFTQLIFESDVAQTLEVIASDEPVADNRLVGHVDITGGIDIKPSAEINNAVGTVNTAAAVLVPANDKRNSVLVVPIAGTVYVGGPSVTVANGIPVSGPFTLNSIAALYAVAESNGQEVRWMEETK